MTEGLATFRFAPLVWVFVGPLLSPVLIPTLEFAQTLTDTGLPFFFFSYVFESWPDLVEKKKGALFKLFLVVLSPILLIPSFSIKQSGNHPFDDQSSGDLMGAHL